MQVQYGPHNVTGRRILLAGQAVKARFKTSNHTRTVSVSTGGFVAAVWVQTVRLS